MSPKTLPVEDPSASRFKFNPEAAEFIPRHKKMGVSLSDTSSYLPFESGRNHLYLSTEGTGNIQQPAGAPSLPSDKASVHSYALPPEVVDGQLYAHQPELLALQYMKDLIASYESPIPLTAEDRGKILRRTIERLTGKVKPVTWNGQYSLTEVAELLAGVFDNYLKLKTKGGDAAVKRGHHKYGRQRYTQQHHQKQQHGQQQNKQKYLPPDKPEYQYPEKYEEKYPERYYEQFPQQLHEQYHEQF
ncbi:hypothetical protein FN846DRAFT_978577 [Sphaerosporella brunnea]|uniref:Uncharacterized protein n=1 Tax=Sphaerosporella brunnea TaxID=1250544 RepID=A0A5J5ED57_9PEZI|nr:hypothetical protein FN846DRAFT_978577 [Sphaerosporella brunnea]